MIDLARIALNLTSLVLLWAIAVMLYGLRTRSLPLVQSGRRAITATFVLVSLAGFELVYAFISAPTTDESIETEIAQYKRQRRR